MEAFFTGPNAINQAALLDQLLSVKTPEPSLSVPLEDPTELNSLVPMPVIPDSERLPEPAPMPKVPGRKNGGLPRSDGGESCGGEGVTSTPSKGDGATGGGSEGSDPVHNENRAPREAAGDDE